MSVCNFIWQVLKFEFSHWLSKIHISLPYLKELPYFLQLLSDLAKFGYYRSARNIINICDFR
jgi:hypothetical protein